MLFHFIKLYEDFLFQRSGADLVTACGNGDNQGALDLIKADANLNFQNKDGKTALMKACWWGDKNLINILIKKEANLNIQDKDGNTALIRACSLGHKNHEYVANILIKANANLNIQDKYGDTALMQACWRSHKNIVNILIKAGANLDIHDKEGETALMWTCYRGHELIANILIKAGANLDIQDKQGMTALMHACDKSGKLSFSALPDVIPSLEQVNALLKITNLLLLNGARVCNLEKISKLLDEWCRPSIKEEILQKMVITNNIQTDPLDNPSESLKLFQSLFELNEEEVLTKFCYIFSLSTKYNNTDKAKIMYKLHQEFAPDSKEKILNLQQVLKLSPEELLEIYVNNPDIFNLNDFNPEEINPEGNLDIDLLFDPLKAQQIYSIHQIRTTLLSNQDRIITNIHEKIKENKEMVLYYCWYKDNKATEYGINIQHKIFNKVVKNTLFENLIFIQNTFNLPNLSHEIANKFPDELMESVIEEHEKLHISLPVPEDTLSLENNIEVEIIGDIHPS